VRLDTWFLGKTVTFGVKLFTGKELSGENAISRFLHFLRFFARSVIKSGSKCSKRCTFCAILAHLRFCAKNKGSKVK